MKLLFFIGIVVVLGFGCWALMIRMPGKSYQGILPPLTGAEETLRDQLRRHVRKLAGEIGERNLIQYTALREAADYVHHSFEQGFEQAGYGNVERQTYDVAPRSFFGLSEVPEQPLACANLIAEIPGSEKPAEIVVVGAHYDSVEGSPGANDNATGVAAVLALARSFAGKKPGRTLRFLAFVNEEPPYFQTPSMGSLVYARRCQERQENVVAMLSLETIGYYSDEPGSQNYPAPLGFFHPSKGNFVAVVGDTSSRRLVRKVIRSFRGSTSFPSQGAATFGSLPGVGWSDHWSFWQAGYSGVMVTDTALYRYPYYHGALDTPDKIDYDRLARLVVGIERVIDELAAVRND